MKPNLKKAITEIAKSGIPHSYSDATIECPNCGKVGKDTEDYKTPLSKQVNKYLVEKRPKDYADMQKYVAPYHTATICTDCAPGFANVIRRNNPPQP